MITRRIRSYFAFAVLSFAASSLHAQAQLSKQDHGDWKTIDAAVKQVMVRTGVPSVSLGIVQDGRVVYTHAYGNAKLQPALAATPAMHYAIGSISKQFTSACVLLLAEQGKLTLDDPVSRWFPDLTRSGEVTLRNLLTHTSGYEDYAPQDYTIPAWTKPTNPQDVVNVWAKKPLDFDPDTKWQYSNTNFVLAGLIVEQTSGMPFWQFLETQVLQPMGMREVLNLDTDRARMEPQGYMRNALAPLRPAILEAPGWYFADGELAMPVAELLRWDIGVMNQELLKPDSWKDLETEMKLKDGTGTQYGLGVDVQISDGHRVISHTGEVGGFVAANAVYPDDKVAIAVQTNQEANSAASDVLKAIVPLVLHTAPAKAASAEDILAAAHVKDVIDKLEGGQIDRSLLTPDASFYFSKETIHDFSTSLSPLGLVKSVALLHEELRGGMSFRIFDASLSDGTSVRVTTYTTKDGKLEQFLVEGKN
jgi:CubicO group peptidase (beta-lactamase class C family)